MGLTGHERRPSQPVGFSADPANSLKATVLAASFYPAVIYGGPIYSVLGRCKALTQLGVHVNVVTTNANGTEKLDVPVDEPVHFSDRMAVHYFDDTISGNRFSWSLGKSCSSAVSACDVFHTEELFYCHVPQFLLAAQRHRKPALMSPRGVLAEWALLNRRPMMKKAWLRVAIAPFSRSVWWHATSEMEKHEIVSVFPGSRVVVIPNGIDLALYRNAQQLPRDAYLRKFTGRTMTAENIVVSAGRLHRKKGYDILIKAFERVRRIRPNAVLLIAGSDEGERARLEAQVAGLQLQERIFFVGQLNGDDWTSFLAGADLFAFCSHSENFGNVIVEALASGVPVVSTRGTPWERLDKHECGHWVTNEPEAVAEAILSLLAGNSPQLRARARILADEYGWNQIGKSFLDTYRTMLKANQQ